MRKGIGSVSRIGYRFICSSAGYNGSCFSKDVKEHKKIAEEHNCNSELIGFVRNKIIDKSLLLLKK